MFEVIKQVNNMRLIRHIDECFDIENLKGDCYNPTANPDIEPDELKRQEQEFEDRVYSDGVYGYEVQRWNPEIDCGWEHVDSIYGFVGNDFEGSGYDIDLLGQLEKQA